MSSDGFLFDELTDLQKEMILLVNGTFPKETKKFMKREAGKLKKLASSISKNVVKKNTGNYLKGFKSGKVYSRGDDINVRAYNGAPHSHLIEYGHIKIGKDGKKLGFVEGRYIFEKAEKQFQDEFSHDIDRYITEMTVKCFK